MNKNFIITHSAKISTSTIEVDGKIVKTASGEGSFLSEIYRFYDISYPKFFKMDILCKVGFLTAEALLIAKNDRKDEPRDDRAILIFNKKSSLFTDSEFYKNIIDNENFYPKPSLFVYTLPNIVTGEIAIRNKYLGETSLIVLPEKDDKIIFDGASRLFYDENTRSAIVGWLDAESETNYESEFYIVTKQ